MELDPDFLVVVLEKKLINGIIGIKMRAFLRLLIAKVVKLVSKIVKAIYSPISRLYICLLLRSIKHSIKFFIFA